MGCFVCFVRLLEYYPYSARERGGDAWSRVEHTTSTVSGTHMRCVEAMNLEIHLKSTTSHSTPTVNLTGRELGVVCKGIVIFREMGIMLAVPGGGGNRAG